MLAHKRFTRMVALLLTLSMCLSLAMSQTVFALETPVPIEEEVTPIYLDKSYSFEERAADLVSRMTINEKASQMISGWSPAIPRLGVQWYGWWNEALHGVSRLQRMQAGNATTIYNTTSYPISLSMGSTWNPELMYRVATEISNEAREVVDGHNNQLTFWSPTVNLNRDPRWGRSDESFGEDPYLTAAIASQFVNGMEGKDMQGNLLDPNGYLKSVSTIKHYLGNNSENNRLNGSTNISERELREYYSYVYRLIVEQSDVSSVMASYNRVNEVPANLNTYILDTLLRQTFGFSGYVTSDCDSVWIAFTGNGYDRDPTAASGNGNGHGWRLPGSGEKITNLQTIAWAINAGGDLDCNAGYSGRGSGFDYAQLVPAAAREGIVTPTGVFDENSVDTSLVRLFTARMKLGEFDDQDGDVSWYNAAIERIEENYPADWTYASSATNGAVTMTAERSALAREAGRESLVLLKNEPASGSQTPILPLQIPTSGAFKVAVIGHFARPSATADSMFLGGYSANMGTDGYTKMVNPYNGISNAIKEINPNAEITFYKGFTDAGTQAAQLITIDEAAITAAAAADLCIVYTGTDSNSANEQNDRIAGLTLPGAQADLIKRVGDVNPKTVAVMETISPNDVTVFEGAVPAMLWSCYNGQVKGEALADVLVGKYNPSARTSSLWFRDVGQLNNTKSYRLAPGEDVHPYAPHTAFAGAQTSETYSFGNTNGRTYMYYDESLGGPVKYPFGYGLSYTTFKYDNLRVEGLSGNNADANDTLTVTVDVTNTGSAAGSEVVQLYIATPGAPAAMQLPIKRLVGFDKVEIPAGEMRPVTLEVDLEDCAFFNEAAGRFEVYNGNYQLQVAKNSKDVQLTKDFAVTGSLVAKINVVTAKPNQEGDTESDIPTRVIYQPGKDVNAQLTIAMSDDTLYGYVHKGESKEIPSSFSIEYSSNRPSVVEVNGDSIVTREPGVATVTATVTDSNTGSTGTCDFVIVVNADNLPYLSGLKLNGEALEGFNPYVYEYNIEVPAGAEAGAYVLSATAGDSEWAVVVNQLTEIPGSAKIVVSNDYASITYTVSFTVKAEEPARIVGLTAENGSVTAVMNKLPAELALEDFSGTISLDAFEAAVLQLNGMTVNPEDLSVTFTFDPVASAEEEQLVNISIQYLDTPAVSATYTVAKLIPVQSIKINSAATSTVRKNKTLQLAPIFTPANANYGTEVTWTSSNTASVKVDAETGLVTGIKAGGSARVTATTSNGKTYTITVTVDS